MARKLKILIVDDNESLCENLKDILEFKGYEVVGVYNGYQAIETIKKHCFEIVLMDIKMPGLNGLETLRILQDLAPKTIVIMLTAYADDLIYKEKLKTANFQILQKPIDIEKLCALLEKFQNNQVSEGGKENAI